MASGDIITEEIKARLDIIDLISDYVDLKKSGNNYKALCPFHSEKTPSFTVSPQKQIFHCFGCGAGGDLFGFIMKYENISFPEAVGTLAKRAGVEIKTAPVRKSNTGTDALYGLHSDALEHFISQLEKSPKALNYLKERGLDDATVKTFKIGYSPPQPDSLYRRLKSRQYGEDVMERSGIIKFPEGRRPYDMFRGRIIFPIFDISDKVVAFGARILDPPSGSNVPKYINSSETPIFRKGHTLYGLNTAKNHIREKRYAIICEGYLDVIICHQFGFKNAVAPLGTAFTEGHVKRLRAHTKKVLLVFDGDEAGLRAAKRAIPIIYENGLGAKVLLLPEGLDPDGFLKKNGAHEFQKLFPSSKNIVDFYLELGEDGVEIIRELIGIASGIKDAILRGQTVREISHKTFIPEDYLVEEIRKIGRPEKKDRTERLRRNIPLPEETLMAVSFLMPEHSKEILSRLKEEDIEVDILKSLFAKVMRRGGIPPLADISSVFEEAEVSYITSLTIDRGFDKNETQKSIDDCFRKLRERTLRKNREDIELRIKVAESSGDITTLNHLLSQKHLIQQQILQEGNNEGIL